MPTIMTTTASPFTHLLITRFNIRVAGYGPERMESPSMTEEWLEERFSLFTRFCAPSVVAQTEKNFIWLWYLAPETPVGFIQRITSFPLASVEVDIRYVRDYSDMLHDTQQYIRRLHTPFVITTRLDNDDIISQDFIARVQSSFLPQERTIINFLAGYEYGSRDHVLKRWNVRYMNQFISLIESTQAVDLLTIYQFPHWKIPARANIVNIGGSPYWIYLRHALNYSEQKINAIPVFRKSSPLARFPAFRADVPISFLHTLRYAIAWFPHMVTRRIRNVLRIK